MLTGVTNKLGGKPPFFCIIMTFMYPVGNGGGSGNGKCYGYSDSSGYGYGKCYGYCNGWGYGDGDGNGYGNGSGYGYGKCYGYGTITTRTRRR